MKLYEYVLILGMWAFEENAHHTKSSTYVYSSGNDPPVRSCVDLVCIVLNNVFLILSKAASTHFISTPICPNLLEACSPNSKGVKAPKTNKYPYYVNVAANV